MKTKSRTISQAQHDVNHELSKLENALEQSISGARLMPFTAQFLVRNMTSRINGTGRALMTLNVADFGRFLFTAYREKLRSYA